VRRVVVVGNGMAGSRFVAELLERDLDRDCAITLVGDEPGTAYNRVLLSNVLAGVTRADAIEMASESWYSDRGVELRPGTAVRAVDLPARTAQLADATELPYDVLVLATGSTPSVPPIPGIRTAEGPLVAGAELFRTRADCAAIHRWAATARRVIVVGAGVLGLEAARALAGRGRWVTVVQREDRLMERQLDARAAAMLARALDGLGIEVRTGVTVTQVHGGERLSAVTLSDGTHCDADLIVLCCGVRPRVELARAAGLAVADGVLVDDQLRSVSDEHVYAIGECCEHDGKLYGLVAPVWEQARVAAGAVADAATAGRYRGSAQVTRLKAAGIELAAIGEHSGWEEEQLPDDAEIVTFTDSRRGVYQKLVLRDGRLTGAVLLGDARAAGTLAQLFERNAEVPEDRAALLMPRRVATAASAPPSPAVLPARATICQCNGVTKAAICSAWQDGARTPDEIARRTRATTGCGTCRDAVAGVIEWLADADPTAAVADADPFAAVLA
jgi:assimilatory nitrate reductase electron transfer subunit